MVALDVLDIKVIVWNDKAEIKASVPLEFITTGQTSGCLIQLYYEHPSGKESLSILPA